MNATAVRQRPAALGPLLAAARRAEELSRDLAAAQAQLAPDPALRRALLRQSRQEAVHAALFSCALACLPGRARCPAPVGAALAEFERRLRCDLAAGALAPALFGLQGVLEVLGSVALEPPPGELASLGDQLLPLRHVVLQQEHGHRRLAELWLPRLLAVPSAAAQLRRAGPCYLELAQGLVAAALASLECFERERSQYAAATGAALAHARALMLRQAVDCPPPS